MTLLSDLTIFTTEAGQKWVAATNRSPYFCFEADTREAVLAKAKRALVFYESASHDDVQSGERERRATSWQTMSAEELIAA